MKTEYSWDLVKHAVNTYIRKMKSGIYNQQSDPVFDIYMDQLPMALELTLLRALVAKDDSEETQIMLFAYKEVSKGGIIGKETSKEAFAEYMKDWYNRPIKPESYRESMDVEVLHSWARDAQAYIDTL